MLTHRPRVPFHLLRAAAVATAVLSLSAGAHLAGGGLLPSPAILLAVLALTALASTTATRLKLGFPALAALLGGGQAALHELFTAFAAAESPAGRAAPAHAAHFAGPPLPASAVEHVHRAGMEAGPWMVAAHALATLGCALLLAKGEAALWALAGWLRPLIDLPRVVASDAVLPPSGPCPPDAVLLSPWRNICRHSRRGPPAAVVPSS